MAFLRRIFRNQNGMVLYVSLLLLILLMAAGVGGLVSMQTDLKITANLRSSALAFYLAEAGIEWGKGQIYATVTNPPSLSGATQNLSPGSFSVSFSSPVKLSPLAAKLVIHSTGMIGQSSHIIQAEITKTYDLSDGAIVLRGNGRRVSFEGNFLIDGRNHDPITGEVIASGRSYPAISVSDEGLKERVVEALAGVASANLAGGGGSSSAIAMSDFFAPETVAQLADELCRAPHAVLTPIPAEGALTVSGLTWGIRASPQLRCVDGLPGAGDAVRAEEGFGGVGILVVRDAEILISGNFHWEGLILVTGDKVGVTAEGDEAKEIYGSLIINESNRDLIAETAILQVRGALRALQSRAALNDAAALIPPSVLEKHYGLLPAELTQNYWRTITP